MGVISITLELVYKVFGIFVIRLLLLFLCDRKEEKDVEQ
jgi:hypothetical protein